MSKELLPIRKQRDSNIELYRIVCMFLIVVHHFVFHSGLTDIIQSQPTSTKSFYLLAFGLWGKTAVNCFVIITGYYMCKSHITMRKFLKLFLQIAFYNIVITSIFVVSGYEPSPAKQMLRALIPFVSIGNGFTNAYLIFFLFIPFLNILINHVSQQMHLALAIALLLLYSVLGNTPLYLGTSDYVSWFCVLYIVASYIRLYHIPNKERVAFWGWLTLLLIAVSIATLIATVQFAGRDFPLAYQFLLDSNKPFPLMIGITSFLFFKNVKVPQSSMINTVAAGAFGVLLISDSCASMRYWLWKVLFGNFGQNTSNGLYLTVLLIPAIVFTACVIIDHVRIKTIEKPSIDFIMPYAESLKRRLIKVEGFILYK